MGYEKRARKGGKVRVVWLDRKVRYLEISIAFHGGSVERCRGWCFKQGGVDSESESQCLVTRVKPA